MDHNPKRFPISKQKLEQNNQEPIKPLLNSNKEDTITANYVSVNTIHITNQGNVNL